MDQFPRADCPYLFELTIDHVLRRGYNYGNEFDVGLDLVLDQIAQLTERSGRSVRRFGMSSGIGKPVDPVSHEGRDRW